jgi:hypothetical protein
VGSHAGALFWPDFLLDVYVVFKPCCGVLLLAAVSWQVIVLRCLWSCWWGLFPAFPEGETAFLVCPAVGSRLHVYGCIFLV